MTHHGWRRISTILLCTLLAVTATWFLAARAASARGNVGAPVRQTTANHTVSVGGHGEVAVPPDMATITLGVETKGDDAATALSEAASKMAAVISAVEAQDVPAAHIQTTNLSVYYDTQGGTYVADHEVTVQLDGTSKVGAVLDAAVAAGANNSWGVSFGLKDPAAARAQALQAAITDARSRADAMATALGVSITGVGAASEASYSTPPIEPGVRAAAAPSASTPVQPGELTVTADVNVIYTFG